MEICIKMFCCFKLNVFVWRRRIIYSFNVGGCDDGAWTSKFRGCYDDLGLWRFADFEMDFNGSSYQVVLAYSLNVAFLIDTF